MEPTTLYQLAADAVLLLHALLAAFVVLGLLLVLAGAAAGWSWIRNPWFRVLHLAAVLVIVLQAWLGRLCPLTILESELRARAGEAPYAGTFVSHWLQSLLYYDLPAWVFTSAYTVFAVLVLFSWLLAPPRR